MTNVLFGDDDSRRDGNGNSEADSTHPANSPAKHQPEPERPASSSPDSHDPFGNLDSLRLSQDFASQASVRPVFTTIPVRKPNRQEFIRVRPGTEWRFETGTFTDSESREVYMVVPQLWLEMPGEVKPTCLLTCVSRNSPVPFLWPVPLPGPDGRPNRWHESAFEASRHAEQNWLRVVSDMGAGCYVPHIAVGNLADPGWPEDLTMADLLRLAFKDRLISDVDHPALRRLRGEA